MKLVALLVFAVSLPAFAQERTEPPLAAPVRLLIQRFHIFPSDRAGTPFAAFSEGGVRLFHMTGDPDSLFTLGDLGGGDRLRVKAAVELNDVILRAIAPDQKVGATDTRQRAAGDYRALDARGRPYQLRLGARLIW